MKRAFFAALLALLVTSCVTRAYIDTGEMFGVRIGMPMAEAREIMLRRGLQPGDAKQDSWIPDCAGRRRGPNDQIEFFFQQISPDASHYYCILGVDGRVAVVGWGDDFL
jgi:hypothetical protein